MTSDGCAAERRGEQHAGSEPARLVVPAVRAPRAVAIIVGSVLLGLLLVVVVVVWVQRRPIATRFLQQEFERRGVDASYTLDRVGFRTQKVSNLVIGDPRRPDLVAAHGDHPDADQARRQRRGLSDRRPRGAAARPAGRRQGPLGPARQIAPAAERQAVQAAQHRARHRRRARSRSQRRSGRSGSRSHGNGNLRGGFKGRAALVSPRLVPGRCRAERLSANVAVAVVATRPQVDGPGGDRPLRLPGEPDRGRRPRASTPRPASTRASPASTGRGGWRSRSLVAGANGLANFGGDADLQGAARRHSRRRPAVGAEFAAGDDLCRPHPARRRLSRSASRAARLSAVGQLLRQQRGARPGDDRQRHRPARRRRLDPDRPGRQGDGRGDPPDRGQFRHRRRHPRGQFPRRRRGAHRRFDAQRPRRRAGADFGRQRGDLLLAAMAGCASTAISRPRAAGCPAPGSACARRAPERRSAARADIAPYRAGQTMLSLATLRFGPGPGNSTAVQHRRAARRAVPRRPGAGAAPAARRADRAAAEASRSAPAAPSSASTIAQFGALQLGRTRLPVCPTGSAIITKQGSGPVQTNARLGATALNGRLGNSPFRLNASSALFTGERFTLSNAGRAARPVGRRPIVFDAARFTALRRLGDQRHLHRRQGDHRQCPAAARRGLGQVAHLSRRHQRRCRGPGLRPRRRIRASIRCRPTT